MARTRKPSPNPAQAEIDALDLHPSAIAEKRTADLLRSLLATPPEPFTPKAKPKKRTRK